MNKNKAFSVIIATIATLGATAVFAADDGFSKEDLKRMQLDAFSEQMQQEMVSSVRSDLNTSIKSTEVDIKTEVASGVMEADSLPVAPTLTSR